MLFLKFSPVPPPAGPLHKGLLLHHNPIELEPCGMGIMDSDMVLKNHSRFMCMAIVSYNHVKAKTLFFKLSMHILSSWVQLVKHIQQGDYMETLR